MAEAFRLAEKARGDTSPNPLVGAVVVKNGQIIGRGYHKQAGQIHAEVAALKQAGLKAAGADLYVTLEPCTHYGRTPPCVQAIIKKGIKRVYIGIKDPNPQVNGEGIKQLKAHGLEVHIGVLATPIKNQLAAYTKYITTGRPFVRLKAALSLDGKMAAKLNERTNISGATAKREVQFLRKEADAVLTGINSVIIDDPLLTYRLKKIKKTPLYRVVADTYGRLPLTSKLIKTVNSQAPVIVATTKLANEKNLVQLEKAGLQIILCPLHDGQVDLVYLLQELGKKGIVSLLVEAGPKLTESLIKHNLVDEIILFIAPVWFGQGGLSWLTKMPANIKFSTVKKIGRDIMLIGQAVEG